MCRKVNGSETDGLCNFRNLVPSSMDKVSWREDWLNSAYLDTNDTYSIRMCRHRHHYVGYEI